LNNETAANKWEYERSASRLLILNRMNDLAHNGYYIEKRHVSGKGMKKGSPEIHRNCLTFKLSG